MNRSVCGRVRGCRGHHSRFRYHSLKGTVLRVRRDSMIREGWRIVAIYMVSFLLGACSRGPRPGHVQDEALLAGRDVASFPAADEDYYHKMDGGIKLDSAEIKGRNTWLVWSG